MFLPRDAAALLLVVILGCCSAVRADLFPGCTNIQLNGGQNGKLATANYNVGALYMATGQYNVDDAQHAEAYDYVYNVCGGVSQVPQSCNATTTLPGFAAYQVFNGSTTCYGLGKATDGFVDFQPIDPTDPGIGVEVHYTGGDVCPGGTPRSFTIRVYCDQHHQVRRGSVIIEPFVLEPNTCEYEVEMIHSSGCPLQCLDGSVMCSSAGICSIDSDDATIKCFCYDGYCDNRCGTSCPGNLPAEITEPSNSATPALEAVVIVLMIVLLALAGLWYWKSRRPPAQAAYVGMTAPDDA